MPWELVQGTQGYDFLVLMATLTFAFETVTDFVIVPPELSLTPPPIEPTLASGASHSAEEQPCCYRLLAGLSWFFPKRQTG